MAVPLAACMQGSRDNQHCKLHKAHVEHAASNPPDLCPCVNAILPHQHYVIESIKVPVHNLQVNCKATLVFRLVATLLPRNAAVEAHLERNDGHLWQLQGI